MKDKYPKQLIDTFVVLVDFEYEIILLSVDKDLMILVVLSSNKDDSSTKTLY